jgi:hypothetical protein
MPAGRAAPCSCSRSCPQCWHTWLAWLFRRQFDAPELLSGSSYALTNFVGFNDYVKLFAEGETSTRFLKAFKKDRAPSMMFGAGLERIPDALSEAARIDGAGSSSIYRSVILQLARPALATMAIFNLVPVWHDRGIAWATARCVA